MTDQEGSAGLIELATELTIAWVANPNNRSSADDVPGFLQRMHSVLSSLSSEAQPNAEPANESGNTPAVSVRKSLASKDHIISLIDGKPYKSLKRHLARNGMTPDQYRERFGLKHDYPMVAPNYAAQRRELALAIGLGSKGRQARKARADAKAAPTKRPATNGKKAKPKADD